MVKMSFILDKFVEFLATDGEWHNLSELSAALGLTDKKTLIITRFFSRYDFLQFNVDEKRVKIDVKMRELILSTLQEKIPIMAIRP